jgi:protein O-GlcNAc transferase
MADPNALARALELHKAGRLPDAERAYRTILDREPKNPNALFLLGSLAHQTGRSALAIDLIRKAIAANPAIADYHNNLGAVFVSMGQMEEAAGAYKRAIELNPRLAQAHYNLGLALTELKRIEEAAAAYAAAARLDPANATFAYHEGKALSELGRLPQAAEAFRRAVAIDPKSSEAWNDLSIVMARQGAMTEAMEACKQVARLQPNSAAPYNNVGTVLREIGFPDEAIEAYRRALAINPQHGEAHTNLGNVLAATGRRDEALDSLREAIRLKPDEALFHSNLIFTMCFHPAFDAHDILAEVRRWDARHGQPVRKFIKPHLNVRDPDRRLKIAYLSSDFRGHVVGLNLLPYMRCHDHGEFEVVCYGDAIRRQDPVTERIRACADRWVDSTALNDEQLADQIRADGIDILLDLSLHSSNNRLVVFAMEPAPVQATYLAYCSTSGVQAMHYRLSDPFIDPPDTDLTCHSEQTVRLPRSYWCYEPTNTPSEIAPPPSIANGFITFGCLNQFAKVSSATLELWMRIMHRVPGSRLIVHAPEGKYLADVRNRFVQNGIAGDRVEFVGRVPWISFMQSFSRIDIALDPFPYNGGITTCDTLIMGVPVVTLSGRTSVGRGGRSILSNVGLPELIAQTPDDYVNIAAELAADAPRRAELRRTLRDRMKSSPLMDAPGFARDIESAFRQMWRTWCNSK